MRGLSIGQACIYYIYNSVSYYCNHRSIPVCGDPAKPFTVQKRTTIYCGSNIPANDLRNALKSAIPADTKTWMVLTEATLATEARGKNSLIKPKNNTVWQHRVWSGLVGVQSTCGEHGWPWMKRSPLQPPPQPRPLMFARAAPI